MFVQLVMSQHHSSSNYIPPQMLDVAEDNGIITAAGIVTILECICNWGEYHQDWLVDGVNLMEMVVNNYSDLRRLIHCENAQVVNLTPPNAEEDDIDIDPMMLYPSSEPFTFVANVPNGDKYSALWVEVRIQDPKQIQQRIDDLVANHSPTELAKMILLK